ncbi:NADH_oxidase [Hexamita inflata]|uniref:NADH oxidase n=1 Tax=Hexamita inflata TaxID=28002 RepID=A0AA86R921_9EUKA|nr:NADH oxidase [Hexamita inflata]
MGCGNIEPQSFKSYDITEREQVPVKPYPLALNETVICVIGCTHAGTMAAITLRHLDPHIRIIVFEKNPVVSFLGCGIHLAINKTCTDMTKMFYNSPATMRGMGIEIYPETAVDNINFGNKQLNSIDLKTNEKRSLQFTKAIIATGSVPVIPTIIDGIDYSGNVVDQIRKNLKRVLLCKNYQDAQRLVQLKDPNKVLIIGAGLIGMELVWSFNSIGSKVTIADHGEHILNKYFDLEYIELLEAACLELKIDVWSKTRIVKIQETEYGVQLTAEKIIGDSIKTIQAVFDYVILSTGFKPNTQSLLECSDQKLQNVKNVILVNNKQQTSIKDVYAIGDCCTCYSGILKQQMYIPLATHAIRQGVISAYQVTGNDLQQLGTNSSFGIQLFDYSLAATGLNYADAKKTNEHVGRVVYSDYLWQKYCDKKVDNVIQKEELGSHFNILGDMVRDMADMVIESFDMEVEQTEDQLISIIIIYREDTGKILGCQVMGKQDITQIVNAASVAIQTEMTMQELAFSDLGGFDGETKPWGVLQMAAASVDILVPDFEEESQ